MCKIISIVFSLGLLSSTCAQFIGDSTAISKEDQKRNSHLPIFDPSNESVSFLGHSFALKDSRIGIHFESYLSSEKYLEQDAITYQKNLDGLKKYLLPGSTTAQKLSPAVKSLKEAAKYEGDYNVSESLISAISSALVAIKRSEAKDQENQKLSKERSKILKNLEFIKTRTPLEGRRQVNKEPPTQQKNNPLNSTEALELKRRAAEILVIQKKNIAQKKLIVARSQANFHAILVQLFLQRRFDHVVIGCRFYTAIYNDGNGKITLDQNSIVKDFFNKSAGVSPTISGLENFSLEAISWIQGLVHASDNHLKKNQLHAASNRLLEAYAVGEHTTYIQTLPIEKKAKIYKYIKTSNSLLNAIDARDFATAEKLNKKLIEQASDYKYTKMDAYIAGYTRASNQHTNNAFLHLADKNDKLMFEEIENAKALWPNNPRVEEFYEVVNAGLEEIKNKQSTHENTAKEFDDLYKEQRFFEILNEQNYTKFAAQFNIHQDFSRLDLLRSILKSHRPILEELAVCKELAENDQHIQAWERCKLLHSKHSDVRRVEDELTAYEVNVSEYVNLLKLAKKHTKHKDLGPALSCYYTAKKMNPSSKVIQAEIQAILEKL